MKAKDVLNKLKIIRQTLSKCVRLDYLKVTKHSMKLYSKRNKDKKTIEVGIE